MTKVSGLGGENVAISDDCRLSFAGTQVTLRPAAALRFAEALIRSAVRTATREAALSVETAGG
jgi:hypothetical protein